MKVYADYHTHTIYSHGKGTIEDNIKSAIKVGLEKIAICDHGPGHIGFGISKKKLPKMREEIDYYNKKYSKIEILLGVESNIVSYEGDIDVDDDMIKYFDMISVGFHYGVLMNSIKDNFRIFILNTLAKKSKKIHDKMIDLNTNALIKAINRYPIDIITHPGAKLDVDIDRLAIAAAKKNVALEINAKHGHLTVDNIIKAAKHNVNFVLGSDAHHPNRVGDFEKSMKRVLESKINIDKIINIRKTE
ncbi:PHP domain-containing protein [Clostridiaceae bacterium M8S5]|nr:PHP domain-containing protein [Clostridiaceae bacterium M8S5]